MYGEKQPEDGDRVKDRYHPGPTGTMIGSDPARADHRASYVLVKWDGGKTTSVSYIQLIKAEGWKETLANAKKWNKETDKYVNQRNRAAAKRNKGNLGKNLTKDIYDIMADKVKREDTEFGREMGESKMAKTQLIKDIHSIMEGKKSIKENETSENVQIIYQLINKVERTLKQMATEGELKRDTSILDELNDVVNGWRQEFGG